MHIESPSSRPGKLNATATALMTLMAIAATVSAAPPAAQIGCTAVLMEQSGVRGVAAVVAAAAREFFAGEQHTLPSTPTVVRASAPVASLQLKPCTLSEPPSLLLGEHMLNIPPPRC